MDNNYTVDKDVFLNIDRLWVAGNNLEKGIAYAKKNKFESIFIWHGGITELQTICLDLLKDINFLKSIEIAVPLKNDSNIDGLYCLENLLSLVYFAYDNFPLDHSRFPNLKYLYTHFSKNHLTDKSNFNKLLNLNFLKLWHIENNDCSFFDANNSIQFLELTHGKLNTLNGISKLKNLKDLKMYGFNKLIDLSDLKQKSTLKNLNIEKCKLVNSIVLEKSELQITKLYVDKIDSLDFITKFKNIESLGFADSLDGDFSKLLGNKNLKELMFYPSKKHYSYKLEEINSLLLGTRNR